MKTQINKLTNGFTLVELIVVVTILSILSTIGFVSYSSYLSGVRDTNRISQLKAIGDSLHLYETKKSLPLPDEKRLEIKDGATTIAIQGYVGKSVIETIGYTSQGLDPKDNIHYSYYLTSDRKYFQLLAYLEEDPDLSLLRGNSLYTIAKGMDYENRYPYVYGRKLGILTTNKNEPIQEVQSGSLNISNVGTTKNYKSYLKTNEIITGSGIIFKNLGKIAKSGGRGWGVVNNKLVYSNLDLKELTGYEKSCKEILNKGYSNKDGLYDINLTGSSKIKVYCDMTTDGGGWMIFARVYGKNLNLKYGFDNLDNGYSLEKHTFKNIEGFKFNDMLMLRHDNGNFHSIKGGNYTWPSWGSYNSGNGYTIGNHPTKSGAFIRGYDGDSGKHFQFCFHDLHNDECGYLNGSSPDGENYGDAGGNDSQNMVWKGILFDPTGITIDFGIR